MISENKMINLDEKFNIFDKFLTSNEHILRKGDGDWDSSKIFFQLSIEHADNSPLTYLAEKFEIDGSVDWDYLIDMNRPKKIYLSGLKNSFEVDKGGVVRIEIINEKTFLTFSSDNNIIVWDSQKFHIINDYNIKSKIIGVAILTDYEILVYCADGNIEFINILSDVRRKLKAHSKKIYKIKVLNNSNIVSYSEDNTIKVWDDETLLYTVKSSKAQCGGLEDYIDGMKIAYSYSDTIRILDSKYKKTNILKGHEKGILEVIVLEKKNILSHSKDNSIKIWDKSFKCIKSIAVEDSCDNIIELPNHDILLNIKNKIIILSDDLSIKKTINLSQEYTCSIKILNNKDIFIYNNETKSFIYDIDSYTLKKEITEHEDGICHVYELNNGNFITLGNSYADVMIVWDANYQKIATLIAHKKGINDTKQLDSKNLLSASDDESIKLWDIENLKYALSPQTPKVEKYFSLLNNNQLLINSNNTLSLIDEDTYSSNIIKHDDTIEDLIFLENGNFILFSRYSKGKIPLYDYQTFELLNSFERVLDEDISYVEVLKNQNIVIVYDDKCYVYDSKDYHFLNYFNCSDFEKKLFIDNYLIVPYENSLNFIDMRSYKTRVLENLENDEDIYYIFLLQNNHILSVTNSGVFQIWKNFEYVKTIYEYQDDEFVFVKIVDNFDIVIYYYNKIKIINSDDFKSIKEIDFEYHYEFKIDNSYLISTFDNKTIIYDSNYKPKIEFNGKEFDILNNNDLIYYDNSKSYIINKETLNLKKSFDGQYTILNNSEIAIDNECWITVFSAKTLDLLEKFKRDDISKTISVLDDMAIKDGKYIYHNIYHKTYLSVLLDDKIDYIRWYSNYTPLPFKKMGNNIIINDGKYSKILKSRDRK